ncbi:hypothetical protein BH20ACT5_BH20ACT5_14940 [soil metagenome]
MTAVDSMDIPADLKARLLEIKAGGVSVEDVVTTAEWDSDGDPYIRLVVHLSAPQEETWEVTDIQSLRRQATVPAAGPRFDQDRQEALT